MYTANFDRYNQMKYNRCGNSGLLLPAVALGLWHNFGDEANPDNIKEMLLGAFDMGITHFDLANNYGPAPGAAETNFGKVINGELAPYRDEIVISTKAGYKMWEGPYGDWGSKKYMISSLDQSLSRMGLQYVDIFYSHRPDPNTPLEETCEALATAVRSGKALYVGVSNYDAATTARAYDILKNMGVTLLIHQPRYSMLNRWVEDELLDILKEKGMGAACFSPLAQGLLSGRYLNGIPSDSRAGLGNIFLKPENITDELLVKLNKLNKLAENRGQTLAQMALAWVLNAKSITSVIIGASRLSQIKENVGTINNLDFTPDELAEIDKIIL